MYGKSNKSKNQDDSINTLNCSSMDTWNTGSSLKKPANGWENGMNSFGNVDPRMSVPAMPNPADAEKTLGYYQFMQYMQVMQMNAAAAYSANPLGVGLNPLKNLPSVNAQSSYSLASQLPGMPPGRPRPQGGDPRAYSVGRSDEGARRDNGAGSSGGQRKSLTKSTLTYGEYKRQQEMLNNPNMKRTSPDDDGWDDPPSSSRQTKSNAPPVDDWDDEPTPSSSKKPMRQSKAPPVDDWDDEPTPSTARKPMRQSNAPPVDDWNDEPTSEKIRKPHGDPWDEHISKPIRSNTAPKDDWDDEPVAKKKPVTDDWDDEPAPQSSRSYSHTRSVEPVDDWEDAQPAPARGGGRNSFDRDRGGGYRGRGGKRGGGGGGSRAIEKRDGDWDCTDCGNSNFKWRKECKQCGTAGGNADAPARSSRGGYNRGRDRYNRGSRDSSQSSDHHAAARDDWDDEGSVKSNGSNGGRRGGGGGGGYNAHKRRYDDSNRGPYRGRHNARDTETLGDDWDDEPIKAKTSKMPPVPVDGWDDEPTSAPKKRAPSKNDDDWDDDKGPRSPSPEKERRRRRGPSPSDDKYRRLEIELKLQRLENERLKLAFSGRRIGMTPSPPRSPSPEYVPVSRRRRHSPKEDKNKWESRRYRDSSVERTVSSHRRRALEDDTKSRSRSSSKSSSHQSRYSERVETDVKSVKPFDTHMMTRGSVTSAALPPHELKKLPNYAHLYSLPSQEMVYHVEDDIPPAPIIVNPTKKDKKSRWSNQPAQKVEVVVLEEENWDDVDIDEAETPKTTEEITTEPKANDEDNWDDEKSPEDIQKEDDTGDNKKSSSETSEQKDSWDEDDKPSAVSNKSQEQCNQGPKKIDADFLGQQIAVQIEKIRHRQAILVQQHLNTQVLLVTPPPAPQSPPIIIEKLGATIIDDVYDVSMPPPVIISADAIISSDVSPIDSVILAQAIQITNKARGFESIALAPVIHQKLAVVEPLPEIIDLVEDVPEISVSVNSREGIEVLRPTYGLLRKNVQVKPIKQKSKLDENWDDDDEESVVSKKVDINTLSSALKSDDLLQVVSDEENWEDEQDDEKEKESKSSKYEESSWQKDERSHKSKKTKGSRDNDNWDDEESNPVYQQVDPDILARHMAEFAAGAGASKKRKTSTRVENRKGSEIKKSSNAVSVEDENWDDDPELEEASKNLIDPEILAKNVPLHNSMDSEAISSKTNKIVPLENTSESFRQEFGDSKKHREKSKVMQALSSLPSVASMPVSAAIAAYAAQKRKLNEQAYDYQPRRDWKHPDPYSYPVTDYVVPVDYGRVPQSHPTHYGTQYDYKSSYYKSTYPVPTKEMLTPVTVKPKVKQRKVKSPVITTKTIVQVQKKKKLDLNAEDLSDGEIVDSEEDFGSMSDINSANEDDDVIEIPVKVDLVDLTEEEMAAAVKIESATVDIKKEYVLNPPLPTEESEVPKPPEFEDSPESPVNMEVNEDPEEWHKEINPQEDSPASPENMDVTEEHEINQNQDENESFKTYHESPASPENMDVTDKESTVESPASPVDTETATEFQESLENVITTESPVDKGSEVVTVITNVAESIITSEDNKIDESPASPVNDEEPEDTTDVSQIDDVQETQLVDSLNATDSGIAAEDNGNEDSPASPVNNESASSKESTVCTADNETNSSSVYIANEHNIVMKADSRGENECSEESPGTLEENTEEEKVEESQRSPSTNNSSRNEDQPEKYHNEQNHSLSLDPVVHDKKLPEQVEITSKLIDTSLNSKELVTIASTELPVDEISLKNHSREEKPKIDTQETVDCNEEPSKVVEAASESDSEMDDDDILLDDNEFEAAALFLSNEAVEVANAATSSTNENQESSSVEVAVEKSSLVLNGSSIEDDARFNPYIFIKKEKSTDPPKVVTKVPTPTDNDSDIEEVPVTETPVSNRRSSRIRQPSRK
ncbi:unnamed protein product [Diamesa hyperborea]